MDGVILSRVGVKHPPTTRMASAGTATRFSPLESTWVYWRSRPTKLFSRIPSSGFQWNPAGQALSFRPRHHARTLWHPRSRSWYPPWLLCMHYHVSWGTCRYNNIVTDGLDQGTFRLGLFLITITFRNLPSTVLLCSPLLELTMCINM